MHEQTPLWQGDNYGDVTFYADPLADGKLDSNQTVNLEKDNLQWLDDIATATGKGRSTIARQGIKFFRLFYRHHRKLLKYRKTILTMLDTLP